MRSTILRGSQRIDSQSITLKGKNIMKNTLVNFVASACFAMGLLTLSGFAYANTMNHGIHVTIERHKKAK